MIRRTVYFAILAALVACHDANQPSGDVPFDSADQSVTSEYLHDVAPQQAEIIESAVRRYQREQNQPVFQQRFRIEFAGEFEAGDRFDVRGGGDHWFVLLDPETECVRTIETVD